MKLADFITTYRDEIDTVIKKELKNDAVQLNNAERRLWILNNEGLYNLARSEGVRI
jgi:hypothetical protein